MKFDELIQSTLAWLQAHPVLGVVVGALGLLLLAWISNAVSERVVVAALRRIVRSTTFLWDDILVKNRVFRRLGKIVPAAVVYFVAPLVPVLSENALAMVQNMAAAYAVLMITLALGAALTAGNEIYEQNPDVRSRPIKGYLQVLKIALYIMGGILMLATLMNRSPLLFLSGFGAMTAVILLVFKDTILSLVASVQIASNDMLRVGDWVEMPNYNADGDVVDVALHTVQIQNWDKTTTSIPTHKFISESFKNWRTMPQSGGRRIKRALYLDTSSIRYLSDEECERFKRFSLLTDYIDDKQKALQTFNEKLRHDSGNDDANPNARRLTNMGTFRAYVENYLRNSPNINQKLTLLVRQLAPGPQGVPLQIYAFSNDTAWAVYEGIQSDIFDHLLAIVPEFGLRLFQEPTGADFHMLSASMNNDKDRDIAGQ